MFRSVEQAEQYFFNLIYLNRFVGEYTVAALNGIHTAGVWLNG